MLPGDAEVGPFRTSFPGISTVHYHCHDVEGSPAVLESSVMTRRSGVNALSEIGGR